MNYIQLVGLNGLSLAGKSSFARMLLERISRDPENKVLINENRYDIVRYFTSIANRYFKTPGRSATFLLLDVIENRVRIKTQDHNIIRPVIRSAEHYVEKYLKLTRDTNTYKQALLAYLFAYGRSIVDKEVQKFLEEGKTVILDRWTLTGMAYQAHPSMEEARALNLPEEYISKNVKENDVSLPWKEIEELNKIDLCVKTEPDAEIILVCPIEQIPLRRMYRQKIGVGTAGQMSRGQEDKIYAMLQQIYAAYKKEGKNIMWLTNEGTPVESIKEQIAQAVPNYLVIENYLREKGLPLKPAFKDVDEAREYFLEPQRLKAIYAQQCYGRVKEEFRKEL